MDKEYYSKELKRLQKGIKDHQNISSDLKHIKKVVKDFNELDVEKIHEETIRKVEELDFAQLPSELIGEIKGYR